MPHGPPRLGPLQHLCALFRTRQHKRLGPRKGCAVDREDVRRGGDGAAPVGYRGRVRVHPGQNGATRLDRTLLRESDTRQPNSEDVLGGAPCRSHVRTWWAVGVSANRKQDLVGPVEGSGDPCRTPLQVRTVFRTPLQVCTVFGCGSAERGEDKHKCEKKKFPVEPVKKREEKP